VSGVGDVLVSDLSFEACGLFVEVGKACGGSVLTPYAGEVVVSGGGEVKVCEYVTRDMLRLVELHVGCVRVCPYQSLETVESLVDESVGGVLSDSMRSKYACLKGSLGDITC